MESTVASFPFKFSQYVELINSSYNELLFMLPYASLRIAIKIAFLSGTKTSSSLIALFTITDSSNLSSHFIFFDSSIK